MLLLAVILLFFPLESYTMSLPYTRAHMFRWFFLPAYALPRCFSFFPSPSSDFTMLYNGSWQGLGCCHNTNKVVNEF